MTLPYLRVNHFSTATIRTEHAQIISAPPPRPAWVSRHSRPLNKTHQHQFYGSGNYYCYDDGNNNSNNNNIATSSFQSSILGNQSFERAQVQGEVIRRDFLRDSLSHGFLDHFENVELVLYKIRQEKKRIANDAAKNNNSNIAESASSSSRHISDLHPMLQNYFPNHQHKRHVEINNNNNSQKKNGKSLTKPSLISRMKKAKTFLKAAKKFALKTKEILKKKRNNKSKTNANINNNSNDDQQEDDDEFNQEFECLVNELADDDDEYLEEQIRNDIEQAPNERDHNSSSSSSSQTKDLTMVLVEFYFGNVILNDDGGDNDLFDSNSNSTALTTTWFTVRKLLEYCCLMKSPNDFDEAEKNHFLFADEKSYNNAYAPIVPIFSKNPSSSTRRKSNGNSSPIYRFFVDRDPENFRILLFALRRNSLFANCPSSSSSSNPFFAAAGAAATSSSFVFPVLQRFVPLTGSEEYRLLEEATYFHIVPQIWKSLSTLQFQIPDRRFNQQILQRGNVNSSTLSIGGDGGSLVSLLSPFVGPRDATDVSSWQTHHHHGNDNDDDRDSATFSICSVPLMDAIEVPIVIEEAEYIGIGIITRSASRQLHEEFYNKKNCSVLYNTGVFHSNHFERHRRFDTDCAFGPGDVITVRIDFTARVLTWKRSGQLLMIERFAYGAEFVDSDVYRDYEAGNLLRRERQNHVNNNNNRGDSDGDYDETSNHDRTATSNQNYSYFNNNNGNDGNSDVIMTDDFDGRGEDSDDFAHQDPDNRNDCPLSADGVVTAHSAQNFVRIWYDPEYRRKHARHATTKALAPAPPPVPGRREESMPEPLCVAVVTKGRSKVRIGSFPGVDAHHGPSFEDAASHEKYENCMLGMAAQTEGAWKTTEEIIQEQVENGKKNLVPINFIQRDPLRTLSELQFFDAGKAVASLFSSKNNNNNNGEEADNHKQQLLQQYKQNILLLNGAHNCTSFLSRSLANPFRRFGESTLFHHHHVSDLFSYERYANPHELVRHIYDLDSNLSREKKKEMTRTALLYILNKCNTVRKFRFKKKAIVIKKKS